MPTINAKLNKPGDVALEYVSDNIISKIGIYSLHLPGYQDTKYDDYMRARHTAAHEIAYAIVDNLKYSTLDRIDSGDVIHTFNFELLLEDERRKLTHQIQDLHKENAELSQRIHFLKQESLFSVARRRISRNYLDIKMKIRRSLDK